MVWKLCARARPEVPRLERELEMIDPKMVIYGVAVACFAAAGTLDAAMSNWKEAIIAWLFAIANAIIFLWR